jgi:hypothetical protein
MFVRKKVQALKADVDVRMGIDIWRKSKNDDIASYCLLKLLISDDALVRESDKVKEIKRTPPPDIDVTRPRSPAEIAMDDKILADYALIKAAEDKAIQDAKEMAWHKKTVNAEHDTMFLRDIWLHVIRRYMYDRRELEAYKNSQKELDKLLRRIGIREEHLEALIKWSKPRYYDETVDGKNWVVMAIRPEAVIQDLLTEEGEELPRGTIEIIGMIPISKENVEYVVRMRVGDTPDTPANRQLMKFLQTNS